MLEIGWIERDQIELIQEMVQEKEKFVNARFERTYGRYLQTYYE